MNEEYITKKLVERGYSINRMSKDSTIPKGTLDLMFKKIRIELKMEMKKIIEKDDQEVYSQFYPLAYGLYQGQSLTQENIIQINHKFVLPDNIDLANHKIKIQPIKVTTGSVSVVNINSIDIQELEYEALDNTISLN